MQGLAPAVAISTVRPFGHASAAAISALRQAHDLQQAQAMAGQAGLNGSFLPKSALSKNG